MFVDQPSDTLASSLVSDSIRQMSDTEELNGAGDKQDSIPSAKMSGRASLLDSGEDFEILDDEDVDDPPPLEDAGGGKEEPAGEGAVAREAPVDEWMDVLGT